MDIDLIQKIKKSIGFIYIKVGEEFHVAGTGFFVSVKSEYDYSKSHRYFVTAKHVLQKDSGEFNEIALRLNTFKNSSHLTIFSNNDLHFYIHKEEDVDIVIFPCIPNPTTYDYIPVNSDIISTKDIIEKEKIKEGTDILFSGLFSSHVGTQKNQPIIRFGKTSLMSDEKISWKVDDGPAKLVDLYLMECQSYGGNSGSPVFFELDRFRESDETQIKISNKIYLAGIMTGSFNTSHKIENIQTIDEQFSLENVGISAVTPAYKLHEILFSDELIKRRNDNDEKLRKK